MSTLEDLNRIKKANDILNKGFQRVGAKPIYLDPSLEEPNKNSNNSKFEFDFKPQIELLNQVSAKLKKEKEQKAGINSATKTNKLFSLLVIVATATLIYLGFYVYTPQKIINQIKNLTNKIVTMPPSTKDEELIDNLAPGEKIFIISSGIFQNTGEANKYKNELSQKLGIPLKVVKTDSFYTIQIGPNYQEQEDVLVVFDELARYDIKNLSVRMLG